MRKGKRATRETPHHVLHNFIECTDRKLHRARVVVTRRFVFHWPQSNEAYTVRHSEEIKLQRTPTNYRLTLEQKLPDQWEYRQMQVLALYKVSHRFIQSNRSTRTKKSIQSTQQQQQQLKVSQQSRIFPRHNATITVSHFHCFVLTRQSLVRFFYITDTVNRWPRISYNAFNGRQQISEVDIHELCSLVPRGRMHPFQNEFVVQRAQMSRDAHCSTFG